MNTLTLRDRKLPAFAATEAKNEFGLVLETALRSGAVAITKHETVKAVLLSIEEYEALVPPKRELDLLAAEYDALLARMQAPRARRAASKAFRASPEEMGAAAVALARARTTLGAPRRGKKRG